METLNPPAAMQKSRVRTIAILGGASRDPRTPSHLLELEDEHTRAATFAARIPAFAGTPFDRLIVDLAYVEMAQRAAAVGCDAIFIDSFADYGIAAMRAAIEIPVIGGGEAGMAAAAAGGRRYSIVTIWPASMAFLYDERLRMLDTGRQCVGVHHVSPEAELARVTAVDGVMQRMQRHEDAIVDRLVEACEEAVRRDGADCILLGCTCMAPVGPLIQSRVPFPVIESSRTGFNAAKAAAQSGVRHCVVVPEQRRALAARLVDGFAPSKAAAGSAAETADAECPVCIFTPRVGAAA